MKEKLKKLYSYKQFKIILGMLCIFILAIALVTVYYNDKFYPGTYINNVDVSSMTLQEAENAVNKYIENYSMTINGRNDGKISIKASDVKLSANFTDSLKKTMNETHGIFSFYKVFTTDSIEKDFNITFDSDKLKSALNNSILVKKNDTYEIKSPVSAYVQYDSSKGYGTITKESQGNTLDKDKLNEYIAEELKTLNTNVTLEDGKVYKTPKYTSSDKEVQEELTTYNMYLLKWITWDMGEGSTETITPEDIKDWITVNKDKATVSINKDKMSEWIETFCLKYKTVGKTRNFTTHSGKTIQISGGDYGWRLDYDKTVEQAYKALKEKVKSSLVNAYIEEKNDTNKKALTVSLEPTYENTAYKKDYTNFQNDWDTQNYSEVDLSEQKVYVYKNGKLAYSTICVTGLASDSSRATRTGVWYIKDKKLEYTLTGADYSVETKFWVRIMWTGTGYHYMNRSDWSRWSPSLYKTKGSHGCINLQYDSAKTIYNLVSLGDVVFIHD
jgi:lipoprotein-anchoring transpeptidase ErfK/SrfK